MDILLTSPSCELMLRAFLNDQFLILDGTVLFGGLPEGILAAHLGPYLVDLEGILRRFEGTCAPPGNRPRKRLRLI